MKTNNSGKKINYSGWQISLIIAAGFSLALNSCNKNHTPENPNFLFILVDDLGFMDVGFNNPETFYDTPNLDKLAVEGIRFTNAYAACPVCSPTRASIMTGKYPARINTTDYFGAPQANNWTRNTRLLPAKYEDKMALEEITIAEALKEHNYKTFFAGKWHLGDEGYWPEDQGFDINKGGIERGGPYGGNRYFSPYGNPRLEDGPEGEHLPDRLATETIKFIEENKENPFFAYLSFYSVHTPLMGRPDLVEKYERKKSGMTFPDSIWGQEGFRKVRLVQEHTVYAAMVEAMDMAVGKVLDRIIELGLDKNTIVFFMADNGGLSTSEGHPTSNLPLRAGKGWLYEGGIKEPMIIKWPGLYKNGGVEDFPVTSTDFYPTILDMAGITLNFEQHMDGISLVPLLKGKKKPERKAIYWHYPHYGNQGGTPGAAIRLGNFKYIEFFDNKPAELYNLEIDPGEKNNLANKEIVKVEEMSQLLHQWQKEVDARFPVPNNNFDPEKEEYH